MDKQKLDQDEGSKSYNPSEVEEKWYQFWEKSGFFQPEINPAGEPYTIILPLPNANASLHFGHAMFTIEDILSRYHRMKGFSTLWLPGADHAGTETQFVFEKHLASEGKSRFDFDRRTLYQLIWDFVQKNKGSMEKQLRRMGFSLDWSREKFTLDSDIVSIVYKTFKRMYEDKLVYRAYRLVNYCTKDGTSFSDLEVISEEVEGKLYFIKFPIKVGGYITIATTRPETIPGDVAVMVNPKDKRYQKLIGQTVILPLTNREVPIITDEYVDMKFGTGAVKVTPNHDFNDFEIAKKHNLDYPPIIGFDGKIKNTDGLIDGLYPKKAREEIIKKLETSGLIEKTQVHKMVIKKCYKCKTILEPLPLEQWYVKVEPLAKPAIEAVKKGKIKIFPKNFESIYYHWMENIRDWNISRQIVWGIRIPAWKCQDCSSWTITSGSIPKCCSQCSSQKLTQDQDTFDTWFSSGQWPYATLQTTKEGDFDKFYPTTVMETGRDILFFWVVRMIMLGIYTTGKVPFKNVLLHGMVLDPLGQKMSKSKGNVISPMEISDQYGADAARIALVYGTAMGHDQALSHPKLQAMRNFTNKLWNIGRFLTEFKGEAKSLEPGQIPISTNIDDQQILDQLDQTIKSATRSLDTYHFNEGSESLYEFIWHQFADVYIEKSKIRRNQAQPILEYVFRTSLELLHPFMPFITEEIWQKLPHQGKSIMLAKWPQAK